MERNKQIALEILTCVEDENIRAGVSAADIALALNGHHGPPTDIESYHLKLLADGGFLRIEEDDRFFTQSYHLTWSGHDLLDDLRSEIFKLK